MYITIHITNRRLFIIKDEMTEIINVCQVLASTHGIYVGKQRKEEKNNTERNIPFHVVCCMRNAGRT